MGIRNVSIGTINNTTGFISSATSVSYHDYSCSDSTNATIGTNVSVSVRTNGPGFAQENVRIWIDLNNDGSFDQVTEQVFESLDSQVHTGTIQLPSNTVTDTALRMRVAAEWVGAPNPLPTPCGDREYSEVEDYKIVALVNTSPPTASFSGEPLTSCDGVVQFTDLSTNGPDSWLWRFGDGSTDTVQNPLHTYLSNDTFDVTLIASNANGSDSITITDFVIRHGIQPVSATCSPITNAYCCGYGVTRVIFGDIDNSSSDASVGYEDFSCLHYTEVTEGLSVPITVELNTTQPEDLKIYLDLNSDGDFDDANELLVEALNTTSPYNGNILIPPAMAPYSQPIRMRIKSDAVGNFFNGCSNLTRGQAEDYSVIMNPNPFPPSSAFIHDQVNSCQDSINFFDQSLNAPFSWTWYFGDGTTDTVQNPSHTYVNNGTYTVSLVVCNSNGCDSVSQQLSYNEGAPLPNCSTTTLAPFLQNKITNFELNTINYSSPVNGPDYEDFACEQSTDLVQGQSYSVEIQSSQTFSSFWYRVWIDFDDDRNFTAAEEVFSSVGNGTQSGSITIPLTGTIVLDQPIRIRIGTDVNTQPVQACGALWRGQTEDYTVFIRSPQAAPVSAFTFNDSVSCSGSIKFFDQSGFNPTSWTWYFGDGQTETVQNPEHDYTSTGQFTVSLVACNQFGCDSTSNDVTVTSLFGAKLIDCTPTSSTISPNGVLNVTLGDVNNTTLANTAYTDFSCEKVAYIPSGSASILSVNTGTTIAHKVGVWIDYNNNGTFTSNEKVMTSTTTGVHQSAIVVPATAVQNQVLRMRVMSEVDFLNPPAPEACTDVLNGEIEDYGVYIGESNSSPVAFFETNQRISCSGQVAFRNNSFPNATGYEWYFGDGGSSTEEHPAHQYNSPGFYDVTLIAKNGFGSDTLVKVAYIEVTGISSIPLASCYPQTQFTNQEFGIYRFQMENIDNWSTITQNYEDFTCVDTTTITVGSTYGFFVNTGTDYFGRVSLYIDYNNDGDFDDADENIYNGPNLNGNHLGNFTVPSSVGAQSQFVRLRIVADQSGSPAPGACIEPEYGQVEDYAVFINPSGLGDLIKSKVRVYPNPVEDYLNLDFPSEWELDLGLFDSRGTKILEQLDFVQNRIDLSTVEPGLYFLQVSHGDDTGIFKVILK